uniref:Uncharacterized protein n=1 Tax=Yersinia enterocolitica TaxID=630 RepID=B0RKP9_YEREN|nr:hypothetical protein [Yersinia enterocolitica]
MNPQCYTIRAVNVMADSCVELISPVTVFFRTKTKGIGITGFTFAIVIRVGSSVVLTASF